MRQGQLDHVARQVHGLANPAAAAATDGELLDRFAHRQDEAAFEALLARHAALVLGVCRRSLHDPHDVEDAFQAVFLVLARKAGQLHGRRPLSSWLFGVARLVALKMRAQKAPRQARFAKGRPAVPDPLAEITARELYTALDEELASLPEKYRAPLLLCHFEGRTQDEAARHLGLSLASVKRRLEQGRESLRRRLTRRGLTLSAALFAALFSQASRSLAGHALVLRSTVRAALFFTAHGAAPTSASPQVAALAKEVLHAMLVSRLCKISGLLVGLILAISGVGLLGRATPSPLPLSPEGRGVRGLAAQPPMARAGELEPAAAEPKPRERTDRYGDRLPTGAIARLGTVRFRHGLSVDRLTFSPDGKLVASWDCFRGIVLWEVGSGRVSRELPIGINARVVAFSPDGKLLAIPHCTGIETGKIVIGLFDLASDREIRQLEGGSANFPALAFSHDGKLLAATGFDKGLRLWDVATGRQIHELCKGEGVAAGGVEFSQNLAFAPDDKTLASTCGAEPISLWDVATGARLRQLKGHRTSLRFVDFSRDGHILIAAGEDAFRLWDIAEGKERQSFGEKCTNACLSWDGKSLASSHAGGLVRLWDVATGKSIREWRTPGDDMRTMAFSPDGKRLATGGGWNSAVHVWDVASGQEVQPRGTHEGTIRALAFAGDGKTLLAGSSDRRVCRWDLGTRTAKRSPVFDGTRPITAMTLSPDGRSVATVEWDGDAVIRIHDLATGKVILSLGKPAARFSRLAYSPDGTTLASAGSDLVIRLWDLSKRQEIRQFHGPKVLITCLALSPDGRLLAAVDSHESGTTHKVHLWDLASGRELPPLGREAVIDSIAFSPDARILAVAGRGPGIELWEVASGKRIHKLNWAEIRREWYLTPGSTQQMAFSNDGRLLASGGSGKRPEDHAIHLWDVVTGHSLGHFEGHPSAVTELAFGPDDQTLASGGTDSAILLWDVGRRRPRLARRRLSSGALNARWDDLAGADAARAYQAIWELAAAPEDSVPFLKARLAVGDTVGKPVDVDRLIADLDSDRFQERDRATRELERLGFDAEPALRRALDKRPSLEMRRRLERLLDGLESSSQWMRSLRAVQVLEYSATPEAGKTLQSLSQGAAGSRLTRDANAALARLARQSVRH
jgi:RNA polymerase sigma factor (sigma-70 family)